MRKRNRLMAALAAAAAVSLSVIVPATAASAAPPDSWSAIGQVSNSGTCADNVATFTVSVPTVGIETEMQGGFSVNGASLNVENYAVGVISPFTRSVTVPVDTFPSTFTVSYWLNNTAETLFVNEFTFDGTCDATPPVVIPTVSATLTPSADGSGVDYAITLGPDGVSLPQTVIIGYGEQDVATTVTFNEIGTQTGSFPWSPCGTYVFGVFIPDSPVGNSYDVTIPCPNPGDGGGDGGTTPPSGETPTTPEVQAPVVQAPEVQAPVVQQPVVQSPVKSAPPAAHTGDVVSSSSPFLGVGLLSVGALVIAAFVVTMVVRSRKSSATTR